MNTLATYTIQVDAENLDSAAIEALRVAIHDGVGNTLHEGDLPEAIGSAVKGWSVTLSSIATADSDPEAQAAIALLRGKGYAVAAFSPNALGKMPSAEMEPFLQKMGNEAIDDLGDNDD